MFQDHIIPSINSSQIMFLITVLITVDIYLSFVILEAGDID